MPTIRMDCIRAFSPRCTSLSLSVSPQPHLSPSLIQDDSSTSLGSPGPPLWSAVSKSRQIASTALSLPRPPGLAQGNKKSTILHLSVTEVWIIFRGFSTVNGDCRLVFSWPPKEHLGPHLSPSAKVTQGFLELDRPLKHTGQLL